MDEITIEKNWELAQMINALDGEEASNYLKKLIKENIKEKMTTEEIIQKLKEYYAKGN